MGVAIYPNTASVIKSMQTGTASAAGTITISAVNTAKTVVQSFSTGSAGTVAATGSINAASGSTSGISFSGTNANLVNSDAHFLVNGTYGATYGGLLGTYPNINQVGSYIPAGGIFVGSPQYNTAYYMPRYSAYYASNQMPSFNQYIGIGAFNTNGANVSLNATNLTGGTTSLTAAQYGAYLTNSTTLTVTGPCQYQVIEYY